MVNDARFGVTRVQSEFQYWRQRHRRIQSDSLCKPRCAKHQSWSKQQRYRARRNRGRVNGTDRATEFTGDGGPFYFLSNNFHAADAVTVIKGNSTYKFGGDYRVRQNSNYDGGRNNGTKGNYQFGTTDSGFVSGNYNGIGPNDTGSSLANFCWVISRVLSVAVIRVDHTSSRVKRSLSSCRTIGKLTLT